MTTPLDIKLLSHFMRVARDQRLTFYADYLNHRVQTITDYDGEKFSIETYDRPYVYRWDEVQFEDDFIMYGQLDIWETCLPYWFQFRFTRDNRDALTNSKIGPCVLGIRVDRLYFFREADAVAAKLLLVDLANG